MSLNQLLSGLPQPGDATDKDSNGYPAHLYLLFDHAPSDLGFSDHVGTWILEGRNVAVNYRAACVEEPPPIGSIAIMTDADDASESATAYYGDITTRPLLE